MSDERPWIRLVDQAPPPETVVETKIDDKDGCRNVTHLKTVGRLWYFPDGNMYVYYVPTHWRQIVCPHCGNEIDPDVCWCGDEKKFHDISSGHNFVPMGCDCGRHKEPDDTPPFDQKKPNP